MKSEEDILAALADEVGRNAAIDYLDIISRCTTNCESPIERVLWGALFANRIEGIKLCGGGRLRTANELMYGDDYYGVDYIGVISPQVNLGSYRVDLFFEVFDQETGKRWFAAAIECDGHDFHERTKEQARRDKQRDRWFQTRGILVLRFAGSEIWKDPSACAEQIYEAFWSASRRRAGHE